jgi:phosphate transport system protein
MTQHFLKEIELLKRKVLHLAATVEENLRQAMKAVTERDRDLARAVVERDVLIDQMEVELEEDCLKILALHQPVAIDLRFLIAAMKINNDLERIGDLAVNIAQITPALAELDYRDQPFDLDRMLDLALAMVQESADSLVDMDAGKAREVCENDDELDDLHHQSMAAVEEKIQQIPEATHYYIRLMRIARHLERIGDHATNIAEDVIYMVNGEIVRHRGGDM